MRADQIRRSVCVACVLAGTAIARADAPVELDFFEYLGAMVEVDGEWIDPMTLIEMDEEGGQGTAANDSDTATDDAVPAVVADEQLENADEEG